MNIVEFIKRNPFVFLVIPFIIGIIVTPIIKIYISWYIFLISILIFLALLFTVKHTYKNRWIFGTLCFFLLVMLGVFRTKSHDSNLITINSGKKFFIGTITEPISEKPKTYSTKIQINATEDSIWKQVDFNALAYFAKSTESKSLKIGDKLIVNASINQIKSNSNPYTFNYGRYMSLKHIQFQTYIPKNNFKKIKVDKTTQWKGIAQLWQKKLAEKIKTYIKDNKNRGIISAMLLGYREELTPEIKEAYADAGAMHILAVSGLHVGILYLILNYVLFFLRVSKTGRIIFLFVSILIIWLYAFITGFSPSVSRASTMFSIFIVGTALNRQKSIFNLIAVSAFLLLFIDPHLIYYVGFQLSYAAIISIVFFQPIFYKWIFFKHKIVDIIWKLTTVSLAAQIGTFPLTLYYFHQFPNYFLITNLVVIKGTLLLMYVGFFFILFSWLPQLLELAGKLLEIIANILNKFIFFIDSLPYSSFENIYISRIEVVFLYLIIIFLSSYFLLNNKRALFVSVIVFIFLSSVKSYRSIRQSNQNLLIVHDIKNKTAIQYINGKTSYMLLDSTVNDKDILYNIKDSWLNLGIKEKFVYRINKDESLNANEIFINPHFLVSKNLKMIMPSKKFSQKIPEISFNYYLIKNDTDTSSFHEISSINKVILDGSLSYYERKKWKDYLDSKKVNYHDISTQGVFIFSFH